LGEETPRDPTTAHARVIFMNVLSSDIRAETNAILAKGHEAVNEAFGKSATKLGELAEFTKGNSDALGQSSKIFQAGLSELVNSCQAEGHAAFETFKTDVTALAKICSPEDFFKFQAELLSRNIRAFWKASSKNSAALCKLSTEVGAPLTERVTIAAASLNSAN
jgi:hypothetical protein